MTSTINCKRANFFLLLSIIFLSSNGWAIAENKYSIEIFNSFSRALPPDTANRVVYLTVVNRGTRSDLLIGATTPIAKYAELHTHKVEDGMMKMRQVKSIKIKINEIFLFAPGNHHIMLLQLNKTLIEGETFPLILHFQEAGDISTLVTIQSVDAVSASLNDEHEHQSSQEEKSSEIETTGNSSTSVIAVFPLPVINGSMALDQRAISSIAYFK
jgi:hypothetical protein